MKPLMVGICAITVWASALAPASAGWNNVFQPTLFGRCRQRPTTAQYLAAPVVVQSSPVVAVAAPACNTCQSAPPPCNNCTTTYSQRCFYQPVTVMENRTYYEPVTTTQTSYYYEPVTTYRYSCYVDPCTGCSQQVAVPTTSYQLRAQSCPVQSWVQRCVQVPVTMMQKSCYWQPQTTCCQTTVGALIPINGAPPAPPVGTPAPPTITPGTAPSITPTNPPPSISGEHSQVEYKYYPPPQIQEKTTPNASWKPNLGAPVVPTTNPPAPPVKLENIVVGPDSAVEGQVVCTDNTPRAGAKVWFVSAAASDRREVTAGDDGRFHVALASGSYHVYLETADGATHYHSRVDLDSSRAVKLTLVNR